MLLAALAPAVGRIDRSGRVLSRRPARLEDTGGEKAIHVDIGGRAIKR